MDAGAQPGDWVCGGGVAGGGCGNVNFARRPHCNRCGRRRGPVAGPAAASGAPGGGSGGVEIGKCAADKSRGLFAADDWQCAKCANVNWARRLTCNVCNAPKFGEVEARTGYGGGYNERGVVEYRPRRDSDDDEYDEFGRVKKRKGKDSTQVNKVCGNCRHLGSVSDSSAASAPRPPRLSQRPESLDRIDAVTREAPRKRSSTLSNEIIVNEPPEDKDGSKLKNVGHDSKFRHFHRDRYKSYTRDSIMENQVSSTNGVKYRFKGKTIDENFEVTYTLQERINVAAWAIAYQSCKTSANKFEATFDKPAPDFKTIYAWRQRLLNSGCLVDSHLNTETSSREASEGRIQRKRKRRYFRSISTNFNSSDDDLDSGNAKRKDMSYRQKRSSTRDYISFNNDKESCDIGVESRKKPELDKIQIIISDNEGNCTNGSVCRSSTSGAKHSTADGSKRSEGYLTENARSETPEIIAVRAELAQLKSPLRIISPETQFQEDNYFDEPISKKTNIESSFLIPDIPKQSKQSKSTNPVINDASKEMFEDIVSESERYSSDGDFNTDTDANYNFRNEMNTVSDHNTRKQMLSSHLNKLNEKNLQRLETLPNHEDCHAVDVPIRKFSQEKSTYKSTPEVSITNVEQITEKNFSSAMKRIIRSMSNQSDDKGSENIEYIPTKIDPAMAKRNHILFKNTPLVEGPVETWTQSSNGSVNLSSNVNSENKPTEPPIAMDKSNTKDYLSDDDALYKDKDSDHRSDDEVLKTPPRAPDIGSIRQNSDDISKANDGNNFSSLLNFNFSNINAEDLALALQNIQNMSLNKSNNSINESPNKSLNETSIPKKDNIPFLEDMFYPGSPKDCDENKVDEENKCQDLTDDNFSKKVSSPMSRFKSFAIPKPIMLNRLRGALQSKDGKNDNVNNDQIENKNVKRPKKKNKSVDDNNGHKDDESTNRLYDDNDEESEDEEGDLSKYDLWGSDEENDKKKDDKPATKSNIEKLDSEARKKELSNKSDGNQRRDLSKSPDSESAKRRRSDRSGSASSRRSSSSSSSSSSGKPPRNRYDDFILNSEHSKTGSRESSSARSRSPVYDKVRDRDKRRSRSRDKVKDKSRENRDRDRERDRSGKYRETRDSIKPRDKGRDRDRERDRDRDRQRHHHSGTHSNHGYTRGRAR